MLQSLQLQKNNIKSYIIQEPTVEMFQILNEFGELADKKNEPNLSESELLDLYKYMVFSKVADSKFVKLHRQGRFGAYAMVRGQEAAMVGSAYALEDQDWIFPTFRELPYWIMRNIPLADFVAYWQGDERGLKIPSGKNVFTLSIPIATQILHAVGSAWASKLNHENAISLAYFGDGATSEGDFHEGLNFAGRFQLPVVLFCQNNQWAISLPRAEQTHSKTIAQKAISYGIPGIQVDGNDVLAVYEATKYAVTNAREGNGPMLIEAFTYRLGDHNTIDNSKKYRNEVEVSEWSKKDPINRFEIYLKSKNILNVDKIASFYDESTKMVDEAIEIAERMENPDVSEFFEYIYEEMTPRQKVELEELKNGLKSE